MSTTEEMLKEHAAVELEIKRVELDLKKEELARLNDAKEARLIKLRRQQRDIEKNAQLMAQRKANCKHRKGGKGKAGLERGNDSNYAVIRNTMPWGGLEVMCQRCHTRWQEPPKELKAQDPEKYYELLTEWKRACEWPTDNTDSGTQLFLVTVHKPRAPRTIEGETAAKPSRKGKTKAA